MGRILVQTALSVARVVAARGWHALDAWSQDRPSAQLQRARAELMFARCAAGEARKECAALARQVEDLERQVRHSRARDYADPPMAMFVLPTDGRSRPSRVESDRIRVLRMIAEKVAVEGAWRGLSGEVLARDLRVALASRPGTEHEVQNARSRMGLRAAEGSQ